MSDMCNMTNCGGTYRIVLYPQDGGYLQRCSRCKHETTVQKFTGREPWSDPLVHDPLEDHDHDFVAEWFGPEPWVRRALLCVTGEKSDEPGHTYAFVCYNTAPRRPCKFFNFDPHNEQDRDRAWQILMGHSTP